MTTPEKVRKRRALIDDLYRIATTYADGVKPMSAAQLSVMESLIRNWEEEIEFSSREVSESKHGW